MSATAIGNPDMTLADFITESKIYPHSKEYYELIKECNQLELMEMYATTADFIVENASEFQEDQLSAVFVESADKATTDKLKDGMKEKTSKIGTGIDKLWQIIKRAIASFARIIIKWWTGTHAERIKRIEALVISITGKLENLTEDEAKRIGEKLRHLDSTFDTIKQRPAKGTDGLPNLSIGRALPPEKGSFDMATKVITISNKFKGFIPHEFHKMVPYLTSKYEVGGPTLIMELPKIYADIYDIMERYSQLDDSHSAASLTNEASSLQSRYKARINLSHSAEKMHFSMKQFEDLEAAMKKVQDKNFKVPQKSDGNNATFLRVMTTLLTELQTSVGKLIVIVKNHVDYSGKVCSYAIQLLSTIDSNLKAKKKPTKEELEKAAEKPKEEPPKK